MTEPVEEDDYENDRVVLNIVKEGEIKQFG